MVKKLTKAAMAIMDNMGMSKKGKGGIPKKGMKMPMKKKPC